MPHTTPNPAARAMQKLHEAAKRASTGDVLFRLSTGGTEPRPDMHALLQCFAAWTTARAEFGSTEMALLSAMDLGNLLETGWWARLATAATRGSLPGDGDLGLAHVAARLDVVSGSFPAIAALVAAAGGRAAVGPDAVVVVLDGNNGEPPALPRIAAATEAVNLLWTVAEELTGQRSLLRLVGVETGPAAALHFDGLAEPLAELRALLASIADLTGRLANIPPAQHAGLIPGMLPVMDRVNRSGRSDALRVRLTVENGVRRLLEAGAALRGAELVTLPPSRTTGAPPVTGVPAETPQPPVPEADISHLADVIAEERRQLAPVEPKRRMWQGAQASRTA